MLCTQVPEEKVWSKLIKTIEEKLTSTMTSMSPFKNYDDNTINKWVWGTSYGRVGYLVVKIYEK